MRVQPTQIEGRRMRKRDYPLQSAALVSMSFCPCHGTTNPDVQLVNDL